MTEFWASSGYHLLAPQGDGQLGVTDAFLRAYFERPELAPVEESCAAERALHAALCADPRLAVAEADLAAFADPDARDNYRVMLRFRDRLAAAGTLERCYLGLFDGGPIDVAPLFIDHLVHAILRGVLDGIDDPVRARAGELLFREQRITLQDGAVMAADAETVDARAADGGLGNIGRLLMEAGAPVPGVALDVLHEDNAGAYWARSDAFDFVLDLRFAGAGLDALARVLEAWVEHFLGVAVGIQPVQKITDERWVWHIGLDAEASAVLNDLYDGREVGEDRLARLLALFRLEVRDPTLMRADLAGRPVYLGMAMTEDRLLRLKPQNLLLNLPLAGPS
jgi:hypothetical protein